MSPVKIPREGVRQADALSLSRGLGRVFTKYDAHPDLSLRGEASLAEADSLFWIHLEERLDRTRPDSFRQQRQPLIEGIGIETVADGLGEARVFGLTHGGGHAHRNQFLDGGFPPIWRWHTLRDQGLFRILKEGLYTSDYEAQVGPRVPVRPGDWKMT